MQQTAENGWIFSPCQLTPWFSEAQLFQLNKEKRLDYEQKLDLFQRDVAQEKQPGYLTRWSTTCPGNVWSPE